MVPGASLKQLFGSQPLCEHSRSAPRSSARSVVYREGGGGNEETSLVASPRILLSVTFPFTFQHLVVKLPIAEQLGRRLDESRRYWIALKPCCGGGGQGCCTGLEHPHWKGVSADLSNPSGLVGDMQAHCSPTVPSDLHLG